MSQAWYTVTCGYEPCGKRCVKRNKGRRVPRYCSAVCASRARRDPRATMEVVRRRARRVSWAKLGGKCRECGAEKSLHRHHPEPEDYPDWVVVLCARCHSHVHHGALDLEVDLEEFAEDVVF